MLWVKAFHIITIITWFAGLFYLPRLFVYHADAVDPISVDRFKQMERRLYFGITWPSGLLTTGLGLWLLMDYMPFFLNAAWMQLKGALVIGVWIYHCFCGYFLRQFQRDSNTHSSRFYRFFNEFPTVLLITIVLLVVVKPNYSISIISKSSLLAPQSGQNQFSGTFSQSVPASMPSSGQPSASL